MLTVSGAKVKVEVDTGAEVLTMPIAEAQSCTIVPVHSETPAPCYPPKVR